MLNERLKSVRLEKSISQRELAEIIGVSQQTIASWEKGRTEPDQEALNKLANFFNISVDFLIGRTNVMQAKENIVECVKDLEELSELYDVMEKFILTKHLPALLRLLEAIFDGDFPTNEKDYIFKCIFDLYYESKKNDESKLSKELDKSKD